MCAEACPVGPRSDEVAETGSGPEAALDGGGVLHKNAMSTQSLLPDDLGLDPVHTRRYETRVYQVSREELLVRAVGFLETIAKR